MRQWNNIAVAWEVEFTDEFEEWWSWLTDRADQDRCSSPDVGEYGPDLPFPLSSGVNTLRTPICASFVSRFRGKPIRVLYAFDPRRTAILLVGGDKTGDERWYEVHVPRADRLYDQHLEDLKES